MADCKKEKIYAAVLELFKEGSKIKDIKVSDIANKAGIGKGSIYLYFASKDAVIVEAAEYFMNTWLTPFREFVPDISKDFRDIVTDYIDVHLAFLNEYKGFFNPEGGADYINVFNSNTLPGTIEVFQKARLEYIALLERVLDAGVKQNKISFVNRYSVNMAAQAIILVLKYLGFKDVIDIDGEYNEQECKEAAYDMILRVCK